LRAIDDSTLVAGEISFMDADDLALTHDNTEEAKQND
jgi:cytochrome b pre-mRNA-processing protein 3